MNQPVKAALLSGLVFPGVGQISVGYIKRGWSLMAVICVLLYLIISEIIQQMYSVIMEAQKNGAVVDVEAVSKATSALIGFSENSYLNILLILLIVTWVASVIDAYWLGKK